MKDLLIPFFPCGMFRCLDCAQRIDYRALGSILKLEGATEHLIDGSEKGICRLSFEV